MYNPDDRELDRLSAAAGENYTPPGNPNWDVLARTLDQQLPQKKDKRRRGLFWLFLLPGLFLAGAIYWHTRPAGTIAARNGAPATAGAQAATDKSQPASGTDKQTPGTDNAAANETANTNPTTNTTNNTPTADNSRNTDANGIHSTERPLLPSKKPVLMPNSHAPATNPVKNNLPKNNTITPAKTTDKKATTVAYQPSHTAATNEKRVAYGPLLKRKSNTGAGNPIVTTNTANNNGQPGKTAGHNNRKGNNATAANSDAAGLTNDKDNIAVNDQPAGSTQKDDTQKGNKPVASTQAQTTDIAKSPDAPAVPASKPDATATVKKNDTTAKEKPAVAQKPKAKSKNEKAISIGITGGIDMSTVKFEYGSNAGYNIGLVAGYHFNKNWSVQTGAIYTRKNYKLEGDSYQKPASWPGYYKIDLVDGYCRMWEVPLTGRYTFNSKTSTHLFAGAGLSSYFMNREYYNYSYKSWGVPQTGEWSTNKHSQYIFSVLSFSAGIEKPLGRHIIGQLEPYAKLPLAGLGMGKIMLSSFGLNATLQLKKKVGK